jgi:hypothetical protein
VIQRVGLLALAHLGEVAAVAVGQRGDRRAQRPLAEEVVGIGH